MGSVEDRQREEDFVLLRLLEQAPIKSTFQIGGVSHQMGGADKMLNINSLKNPFQVGQMVTTGMDTIPKGRAGKRGRLAEHPDLKFGWFYIREWDDACKDVVAYHYVEFDPFNNNGVICCAPPEDKVARALNITDLVKRIPTTPEPPTIGCLECQKDCTDIQDEFCSDECETKYFKKKTPIAMEDYRKAPRADACVDCNGLNAKAWHSYGETLLCNSCVRLRLAGKGRGVRFAKLTAKIMGASGAMAGIGWLIYHFGPYLALIWG